MLGEHVVGTKDAAAIECSFRHDALPFAEQVWQDTLISDWNGLVAVGQVEADRQVVAANDTALDDQTAEPDPSAGGNVFFYHIRRRIEENDRIPHRKQHQQYSDRKYADTPSDHGKSTLLARHETPISLTLDAKALDAVIKAAKLTRIAGKRSTRLPHGGLCLITLPENHIGA